MARARDQLRRGYRHLFQIRYRLLLVNVLVVAIPLVGVGFARTFEREMLRSLEDDMIHQAQLLRAALADDPTGLRLDQRGPMLSEAARHTRTRIRLLDADGHLVSDSHAAGPPEGPERPAPSLLSRDDSFHPAEQPEVIDVSDRSEVQTALAGGYGAKTRLWENHGRLYLFSALPIYAPRATPRAPAAPRAAPRAPAGHATSDADADADAEVVGVVYVTRSTAPVKFAMFRLRTWLFWVLATALVVTAILSLFLAATISRPLGRLTRIATRIATGDRRQRLALERRDEIGDLARAFDAMTQKLDERVQYTRALAADISHEFKSPLTSIRGAAELLQDGAADDPPARARFLHNIIEDSERLDRLVTRLLELSRIEAELAPTEVFDYEALVREVIGRMSYDVPIKLAYRSRTTQILGRRLHLASVIGNLIDNGCQHASPGTEVSVHISDIDGGRVRTAICNRGPVISQALMARLWDRFFTTRAKQGGTGLGLAIVRSIVAAHGGAVAVASSDRDGTVFWFDLPTR
ncbi:MAG: ATP-binding protein [Haliangiales bacterium]